MCPIAIARLNACCPTQHGWNDLSDLKFRPQRLKIQTSGEIDSLAWFHNLQDGSQTSVPLLIIFASYFCLSSTMAA